MKKFNKNVHLFLYFFSNLFLCYFGIGARRKMCVNTSNVHQTVGRNLNIKRIINLKYAENAKRK